MAVNKKYLSLEEAAVQLGINPEDLVRLREKGEVRGFADGRSWKFKAEDIAEYYRSKQTDSDPDLPIIDDLEIFDDPPARSHNAGDMQSDSDVRLALSDAPRKSQLTGSSAELPALVAQNSDSDVRLIDSPKAAKPGSDSDVRLVKTNAGKKADSDSDVKMIKSGLSDPDSDSDVKMVDELDQSDSDSDVKLLDTVTKKIDSDSDVRMAHSDSDVRLADPMGRTHEMPSSDSDVRYAPLSDSDSDVKIKGSDSKAQKPDSDSDVMLLKKTPRGSAPGGSGIRSGKRPVAPETEDLEIPLSGSSGAGSSSIRPADSGIALAGESGIELAGDSGIQLAGDSGIKLSGDSGIQLGGDSGIRLEGDSGIRLSEGSGLQLMKPADSGISLEGHDSGIRLADSGLNLSSPSSGNLSGKKRKGGSSRKLKGSSGSQDDIEATSPMLSPSLDDDDDLEMSSNLLGGEGTNELASLEFDDINVSDTSEMRSMVDSEQSEQSVVLFDEDEEARPGKKKKKSQKSSDEDLLGMDDSAEAELEELEVGDEDLGSDSDLDDLAFDSGGDELDDSFGEGSSQQSLASSRKVVAAHAVEWSTGVCLLLLTSLCLSIFGALISADLLRTVWAFSQETAIDQGIAWLPARLWQ